ncbi:MAG: 1-deoxy-D-xylulose-5-phosphate reductoisomerase [Rhodobacteraceae bacterium]|nr:1-deoxy-D-xylulose-5-phosphate reductoisomerase [Paracoccaceae bacterium]
MKRVSIFGATGSIGQNTLDLIGRDQERFQVDTLTGGHQVDQLAQDAQKYGARMVVTAYDDHYQGLKSALSDTDIQVGAGASAMKEAASRPVDMAMSAIVGAAGLEPGLTAMNAGADLLLANKESMVAAGALTRTTARENNVALLPVDSEHSGVFQVLQGEQRDTIERVILTASGGAFRDYTLEQMQSVTPEQACDHPTWAMGQRITVDSASMFNKALEVIEAKELFDLTPGQIEVLVHRQSLVHALVEFQDAGIIAHVGPHDMRHAIGYALYGGNRANLPLQRLDFTKIARLDFAAPDLKKYPSIDLAYQVMRAGGLMGAAFNAAKEKALDAFLARQIGFLQMSEVVKSVIDTLSDTDHGFEDALNLEHILGMDALARDMAESVCATQK